MSRRIASGRGPRVRRPDDGTAHHQVVGSQANGLGRGEDPLLVAGLSAGGADARGDDQPVGADDGAHALGFRSRADDAVQADVAGLGPAARHQVGGRSRRVAGLEEIALVVGGQHGDAQNLQGRSGPARHRRPHGLGIGVDGEKGHAEAGDRPHPFLHRVGDVVQLEVEKHLLALGDQVAGEIEPARIGELVADLVEGAGLADAIHQGARLRDASHIEADDEPVAGAPRRGVAGKGEGGAHAEWTFGAAVLV